MKLSFDLDDVIVQFFPSFLRFYNARKGTSLRFEDVTSFKLWEIGIGESMDDVAGLVHEFHDAGGFSEMSFVDGAQKGFERVSREHETYVVTSRPRKYEITTIDFFKRNLPYFPIERVVFSRSIFASHGHSDSKINSKAEICRDLGIDCHVDDYYGYAEQFEGGKVLLFNSPWNQNGQLPQNIDRVYGWNGMNGGNGVLQEIDRLEGKND